MGVPTLIRQIGAGSVAALSLCLLAPAAVRADATRCTGDCNADVVVTVDELVGGVRVALGLAPLPTCDAFDADHSGGVGIDELVAGIGYALDGCPRRLVGEKAFFDTLHGDRDRAEETVTLFEQAVADDPTDGRSYFLLGMTHLLQLSREQTDIGTPSQAAVDQIARASAALDNAVPLMPEDTRIPGFRAAATYVRGVMLGDADLETLGLSQLRAAFDLNPLFNSFDFIGTVPAIVSPDDPLMAEAVDYLEYALSPEGLSRCTPNVCFNAGKAPHNIEGSFVLFGDIFAKAGQKDRASMYYRLSANFAAGSGWRFVDTVEARLATLDDRVARYQDDDPENDPPILGRIGTQSCAYCHYR